MAPGTLWRRALRRVERRARLGDPELLREACRLADRLAYCAGIAGPLARKETSHGA